MPSGKSRLYVSLQARSGKRKMLTGEDTYHWSLIVGPKKELPESRGARFHAKEYITPNGQVGWHFEEKDIPLAAAEMLLVRVCIGKIEDDGRVREILRGVPIRDTVKGWNCISWVKEALELLQKDERAMGTSQLDWMKVRNTAVEYVKSKANDHRFDGKGVFDMSRVATFDLLQHRETIP